jgi:hypothetical protein
MTQLLGKSPSRLFAAQTLTGHVIRCPAVSLSRDKSKLAKHLRIDPARIGVMGFRYGIG